MKNLIITLLFSVAFVSCNFQSNNNNSNNNDNIIYDEHEEEYENALRETAHKIGFITIKELLEIEEDVVGDTLPKPVLFDETILKEIKPKKEMNWLEDIEWIGLKDDLSLEDNPEISFDHYAVFDIVVDEKMVCYGYFQVNAKGIKGISEYICQSNSQCQNLITYAIVDRISHQNLPSSKKQVLLEGTLAVAGPLLTETE